MNTEAHNGQVHNGVQLVDGYRISSVAHKQEDPHKKDNRACYRGKKEPESLSKGERGNERESRINGEITDRRVATHSKREFVLLFFTSSLV
ncbi:unnamed protein product [Lasius platythorax]|uniref:Uncharacterized protein n=1 Tax=Lasius platythorax TaxID=488582 RepID=A0AAV2NAZ3_9HYME